MVMRVERRGGELVIPVPPEALEQLRLAEGTEVRVEAIEPDKVSVRYISVDEALAAYRRTEPQHREAYRELAK
ncbi:MAG TPA: hypothetical protein VG714_06110 [Acidobacteriaceae bacterium]|nr:hypothetical protein [Acidobacteriaceae bacterium]